MVCFEISVSDVWLRSCRAMAEDADFSGRVTSLLNAQATATALGMASRSGLRQGGAGNCFQAFAWSLRG